MPDIEHPHNFHSYVKETLPSEEAQFAYDAAVARLEKLQNDIDSAIRNYFELVGISKQSAALGIGAKKPTVVPLSGKPEDLPSHEELFEEAEARYRTATLKQEAAILQKQLESHKQTLEAKREALEEFREQAQAKLAKLGTYSLLGVQARAFGLWIKSGLLEGAIGIAQLFNRPTTNTLALLKETEEKIKRFDLVAAELGNLDVVIDIAESKEAIFVEEHNTSVHQVNAIIEKLNVLQKQLGSIELLDKENRELTEQYRAACQEVQPFLRNAGGEEYLRSMLRGCESMEKYDQALLEGKELSSKELLPMLDNLTMSIQTLQARLERPRGALWQMGSDSATQQQQALKKTLLAMEKCYANCQESLQKRLLTLYGAVSTETTAVLMASLDDLEARTFDTQIQYWKTLEETCLQSCWSGRSTEEKQTLYKKIAADACAWRSLLESKQQILDTIEKTKLAGRETLQDTEDLLDTLPFQISSLCALLKKSGLSLINLNEIESALIDPLANLQSIYEQRKTALDQIDSRWLGCKALQQGFVGFAHLLADVDPQTLDADIARLQLAEDEMTSLHAEQSTLQANLATLQEAIATLKGGPTGSLQAKQEELQSTQQSLQECRRELAKLQPSDTSFLDRVKQKFIKPTPSSSSTQALEQERLQTLLHYFEAKTSKLSSELEELQTKLLEKQRLEQSLGEITARIESQEKKRVRSTQLLEQLQIKQIAYDLFGEYKDNLSNYQTALSALVSPDTLENKELIAELKRTIAFLHNQIAHSSDQDTQDALQIQLGSKQRVLQEVKKSVRAIYNTLEEIRGGTEGIFFQLSDFTREIRQLLIIPKMIEESVSD